MFYDLFVRLNKLPLDNKGEPHKFKASTWRAVDNDYISANLIKNTIQKIKIGKLHIKKVY